jgi:hypothetical protein
MNSLQAELHRLYLCGNSARGNSEDEKFCLMTAQGQVRSMVLELARPADWKLVSAVWRGAQQDLAMPAPAIAVNGQHAFQLWFSLAEPAAAHDALAFLQELCKRYFGDTPMERIATSPARDSGDPNLFNHTLSLPPQEFPGLGHWSAFVASDLASLFSQEPWLDVCPSPESQANILSRIESIRPAVFKAALNLLQDIRKDEHTTPPAGSNDCAATPAKTSKHHPVPVHLNLGPKEFLRNVMNDSTVELHLRIEAAKALLPYSEVQLPALGDTNHAMNSKTA